MSLKATMLVTAAMTAAMVVGWTGSAAAQATAAPAPPAGSPTPDAGAASGTGPSAASGSQLQEVIVTARRTRENLQNVPVAITALSGAQIAQQNIVGPNDLNTKIPSLAVGQGSTARDSATYTIRGQGEQFGGSEPAVITYFDEVPTQATAPGLLFDLQDLQVLKGPQGTLFGRNTTGGAILLEPQHPTKEFGGYVDGTLGDYGDRRFLGALNVPLVGDILLARFAVDINHRDGFTKDINTGREYDDRNYESYRLGFEFRPNSRIDDYLLLNYTTSNTRDAGSEILAVNPNTVEGLGVPIGAIYPGFAQALALQKSIGVRETAHDLQDGYVKIRSAGITNTTTINVTDGLTLKNIFGYRDFRQATLEDIDGTTLPILQFEPNSFFGSGNSGEPSQTQITDEFQIQGHVFNRRLQYILGIYVEYIKPALGNEQDYVDEFAFTEAGIPASTIVLQSLKRDRSRAVFGQFTYDLSDFIPNLKFTGGIRYTADARSQTASNYPLLVGCEQSQAAGEGFCRVHQTANFHAPTGNMSLEYQATPQILFYVATRRGYKSGGFNNQAPDPQERVFGPEFVTDVEVGAKSQFKIFGVNGRLNGDLFRGMFSDLQENGDIFSGGEELTITANAGAGVIQGAELEGDIFLTKNVEISGYYNYTDAYYTNNSFGGVNLVNLPFSETPENKVSLTGRYIFDLPPRVGNASIAVTYAYQSRTYFPVELVAVDTNPMAAQSGYGTVNLHADWNEVFGLPIDISAFASNLTDKTYLIYENNSYDVVGFADGVWGEPRTFGFEGRYHF